MQLYWNVQCSVPYTLYVFLIPCENYQYKFASIGLFHAATISQNWTTKRFLLYVWWFFPVLSTCIRRFMCRILYHIHRYEHNFPVTIFILRRARSILFTHNITNNQSLSTFIHARNGLVVALQLLRLYCLVDVYNWFIDPRLKKVGAYSNLTLALH